MGSSKPAEYALTGETMGGEYHLKIVGPALSETRLQTVQARVDACLREVNRQMSHWDPLSEISRFNRHSTTNPFPVSADFAQVLRYSLELHQLSGGAFDPTLGPLIELWGFGARGGTLEIPSAARIQQARAQCGPRHLRWAGTQSLVKTLPGLTLNLSAVAKGFGVDRVVQALTDEGLTNVWVEIGGEVRAQGLNAGGQPWRAGIETPVPEVVPGEAVYEAVCLTNCAIATSGSYRKFFVDADGNRYCHILDPETGSPVRHSLVSVSVIAPDCLTADGLATTLFVMGPEAGLRWIENQPRAAALFIVQDRQDRFHVLRSTRFPPPAAP